MLEIEQTLLILFRARLRVHIWRVALQESVPSHFEATA